jgi:hypothetical protein
MMASNDSIMDAALATIALCSNNNNNNNNNKCATFSELSWTSRRKPMSQCMAALEPDTSRVILSLCHNEHWVDVFLDLTKGIASIYNPMGSGHVSSATAYTALSKALPLN